MTIKIDSIGTDDGSGRIIRIVGEVDMDSSPALRDQISRDLKDTSLLKVDLSGVSYLDSSGIAVLIQGFKGAQKNKVDFRLLNPSSQVRAVIDLAQLNQLFTIEDAEG